MPIPFVLSANISMLFPDRPFLERIEAAAQAGFRAVECQFPYAVPARDIANALASAGLRMNAINTPLGDVARGEFGRAALPWQQELFQRDLALALSYARALDCPTIHCMSGVPPAGMEAEARSVFLANMRQAGARAQDAGVTLVLEPLNARDRPGYFVSRSDAIVELLGAIDCPAVKLLFDVYHIQISEGDLLTRLGRHWPHIGHIQIASVPGRHEPDEGEVAYPALLAAIAERGWSGFVGAEYNPRGDTRAGLAWAQHWLAT